MLVTRYRARVVALARRMLAAQAPEEAEDVAQEAFVAAYDKRTFRSGAASRSAPGCTVLRSTAAWTGCAPSPGVPPWWRSRPFPAAIAGGDPVEALLTEEGEQFLSAAVAALPPKLRAVFLLRHLDDLSYEEIAVATGVPLGTVKTHLFRARAQLRAALSEYLDA